MQRPRRPACAWGSREHRGLKLVSVLGPGLWEPVGSELGPERTGQRWERPGGEWRGHRTHAEDRVLAGGAECPSPVVLKAWQQEARALGPFQGEGEWVPRRKELPRRACELKPGETWALPWPVCACVYKRAGGGVVRGGGVNFSACMCYQSNLGFTGPLNAPPAPPSPCESHRGVGVFGTQAACSPTWHLAVNAGLASPKPVSGDWLCCAWAMDTSGSATVLATLADGWKSGVGIALGTAAPRWSKGHSRGSWWVGELGGHTHSLP